MFPGVLASCSAIIIVLRVELWSHQSSTFTCPYTFSCPTEDTSSVLLPSPKWNRFAGTRIQLMVSHRKRFCPQYKSLDQVFQIVPAKIIVQIFFKMRFIPWTDIAHDLWCFIPVVASLVLPVNVHCHVSFARNTILLLFALPNDLQRQVTNLLSHVRMSSDRSHWSMITHFPLPGIPF